jgi:2'-5' RNA ligase
MERLENKLIRCFIAIPLPGKIREMIDDYLRDLKRITQAVKWIRAENIHLTLKFLGEIEDKKIEQIKERLPDVNKSTSPFIITINGFGCFPDKRRPRVFWLGLGSGDLNSLSSLHQWLEKQMTSLGFEEEKRRFSPHLTLGRAKRSDDFSSLFTHAGRKPFPQQSFQADHLELIKSQLQPQGAHYTTLAKFSF